MPSPESTRGNIQPIKPSEVMESKAGLFPDVVFSTFNGLIAENFVDGKATFPEKEVMSGFTRGGLQSHNVLAGGWLNVGSLYEEAGWSVQLDKHERGTEGDNMYTFAPKEKPGNGDSL